MSEKLRKQALGLIKEQPLSLSELAERMGIKEKKAFNILKYLFENSKVKCFNDVDNKRRYRLTESQAGQSEESETHIEAIEP